MYSPRSAKKRSKTTRKQRSNRMWTWINTSLLVMITILLLYYFYSGRGQYGRLRPSDGGAPAAPPASAQAAASPAHAAVPAAPSAGAASPSPAASPPAAEGPSAAASPSAAAETPAQAEATPAPSPEAAAPAASADSPAPPKGESPGAEGETAGLPAGGESGKTVTLSFAGDVMFAGKVGELLKQQGYGYPYARLNGLFLQDDLSVVNLETPVTLRGTAANKTYVYKSSPEALAPLKAAGVDAVNLANNHTLDMGEQGLLDTLSNLGKSGIPYVGAGKDAAEAYSAQYFKRGGITIALLGFTRVMPEAGWAAGPRKPGVASAYSSSTAEQAVAAAAKKADVVAVVVHWGKERVNDADQNQQRLAHSLIDAGADLVIGGHPHVLQGVEPYKGKWIAYSTGNFIFTRSATKTTWETAVFQAKCSADGQCALKAKPYEAQLGQPVPMEAAAGQTLLKRLDSLSPSRVNIAPDGTITDTGN